MAVEREEFKFPDEVPEQKAQTNQEDSDDIKIEIEDDTPPEDRGRTPMPKEVVEELDNDDLDEYSDKVKKRLSQMKKVWHDERRAKEAAAREKEEALRFAQAQMEENRQLKQRLGNGEKAFVAEATKAATNQMQIAKDKFRQAYEAGDPDRIAEAQQELTAATLRLTEIGRFRPNSLQNENSGVDNPQQVQAPPRAAPAQSVDSKALTWQQANPWFGKNRAMTAFALGLHDELTAEHGLDPTSDTYYARIDKTMRKRFPEFFEDDAEQTTEAPPEREKPRAQKAANVVAPATRSTAPRQVRLTPSQVAIAKRLGLSNEQYAREVMKLEAN